MKLTKLQQNPFQLFFPAGVFFGLIGVGLWVVWSLGWDIDGVALMHAVLQTQGFLVCFAIGFLMTALPRFLGTDPVSIAELSAALLGELVVLYGVLNGRWLLAEFGFLFSLITLIIFAVRRFPHRTKQLPPSFLLLGFGFLHALLGTGMILFSEMGTVSYLPFAIGRQMVQLGFLLCLVLGITGKLAPFLLGYSDSPESESSIRFPKFSEMVPHGLIGLVIFLSFIGDVWAPKSMPFLRALAATAHLFLYAKISRFPRKRTALALLFYTSLWMIPAGLWGAALFPDLRIALLHLVFIGGFSLMIFSFGLLIVLSHTSQAILINKRNWALVSVGGCVLIAAVVRLCADLHPTLYRPLLHSAAGFWVLGALVWGVSVLRKILRTSATPL